LTGEKLVISVTWPSDFCPRSAFHGMRTYACE
jgi:hypothetical protein